VLAIYRGLGVVAGSQAGDQAFEALKIFGAVIGSTALSELLLHAYDIRPKICLTAWMSF
jgi:hypothetical protein